MTENGKLSTLIDAGVKQAVAKAIERHRRLGEAIAIWEDGKVAVIPADRIAPQNLESSPVESLAESRSLYSSTLKSWGVVRSPPKNERMSSTESVEILKGSTDTLEQTVKIILSRFI